MTSLVEHDGSPLYAGLPQPVHGDPVPLARDRAPRRCRPSSSSPAARKAASSWVSRTASAPIFGVQFHPECVLTEGGYRLLGNWLETVGIPGCRATAALRSHPRR